ncbi:MAG: glutathione S-transferase C-terminal domain-containing protein [Pseudomonadales bacterium]
MAQYRLYGMTHSLYTGKARSYLIKQHADFEEVSAGHPEFREQVMPQIGRWIIPVLQAADGTVIQDGTAIIDWYETHAAPRLSAYPLTPRQRIVSLIFELFGGEGLVRPAMHYRWNFDADNKDYIEDQFGLFAMPHMPAAERAPIIENSTGRMRQAGRNFGVVPETFAAIEAAYVELLGELDAHFSRYPYLLGGAPTIGDYGLIAPLFAHLGRDPHPARLMQQRAPAVFRWTERMNASGADVPEFVDRSEGLLPADDIPPTLQVLLARVAADYLPEIEAFVQFQNDWLAGQGEIKAGDPVGGEKLQRGIGMCTFEWRGHTMRSAVMPYRTYLLQRIQDAFDQLTGAEQQSVRTLLQQAGLDALLTLRSARRVERSNNREVWGELQAG